MSIFVPHTGDLKFVAQEIRKCNEDKIYKVHVLQFLGWDVMKYLFSEGYNNNIKKYMQ